MATSYRDVVESFLDKINDYKMIMVSDEDIYDDAIRYMSAVCADFNRVCLIDLEDRDNYIRCFANDLPRNVIEIIAKGMVVEWLKPHIYRADAMQNMMNLKDASFFAPQQILAQNRTLYNEAVRAYKNAVKDYTYDNGKLGELSL